MLTTTTQRALILERHPLSHNRQNSGRKTRTKFPKIHHKYQMKTHRTHSGCHAGLMKIAKSPRGAALEVNVFLEAHAIKDLN